MYELNQISQTFCDKKTVYSQLYQQGKTATRTTLSNMLALNLLYTL